MRNLTIQKIVLLSLFGFFGACATPVPDELVMHRSQPFSLNDTDADGVIDARDLCGVTPEEVSVDADGCATWEHDTYVKLYTVFFDFDKYSVREDQLGVLEQISADTLSAPGSEVAIVGDTSSEGSLQYNQKLGERRAKAIAEVLIEAGVPKDSIRGFKFTDKLVRDRLFKRQRRTIVRILRPEGYKAKTNWTIYSAEELQDAQATEKAVKR